MVGRAGGSAGRSSTLRRTTRPREVSAPISPRAVVRTAETITSWLARAPSSAGRLGRGRAGEQAGRGEVGEARVVGDLERRGGGRDGDARPTRAARCDAGCRRSWPPRRARRRRPSAAAARRPGSRRAPRWCARARPSPSPARAWRTWSAGAAACRGCSRPGSRSGRRPPISRSLASAALSEERISWMTSSMSRIATSRPSTRWSRSAALVRRYAERRRTTSKRWSRKTSSSSLRPSVRGWPSTSATSLMPKVSSIGVCL